MKNRFSSLPARRARVAPLAFACVALAVSGNAGAQTQVVKPPVAQYWMDVATLSMAGMDEMPEIPDMGALGARVRHFAPPNLLTFQ